MPPLAALLLGAFGVVSTKTAVWIAFVLGLAVLAVQGVVFARVERLRWPAALLVVGANVGLGTALVGLKVVLSLLTRFASHLLRGRGVWKINAGGSRRGTRMEV